jgi:hypothetical protein
MPEPVTTALSEPEPEVHPSPSRGGRYALAAAAALIVAAVAVVAWHIHANDTKANLLGAYPGGGRETSPDPVGRTMYEASYIEPAVVREHEVLDVASVQPVIPINTAAATVVVEECIRIPGAAGVGAVYSTRGLCASAQQFHPGSIDVAEHVNQLIYAITPTRPGTVRITGSEVTYRAGSRHGTQHAGIEITVTTATPK